jgi:hypothetical protein
MRPNRHVAACNHLDVLLTISPLLAERAISIHPSMQSIIQSIIQYTICGCSCRMTTPNPGRYAGGNGGCNLFPTLEWFMQVPGTPATFPGRTDAMSNADTCTAVTPSGCTGNCYNGFFWDPAGSSPDFMDNAVIYGLNVAQGSYAMNVVGYIGSVRVYTDNGYDYTWVFK